MMRFTVLFFPSEITVGTAFLSIAALLVPHRTKWMLLNAPFIAVLTIQISIGQGTEMYHVSCLSSHNNLHNRDIKYSPLSAQKQPWNRGIFTKVIWQITSVYEQMWEKSHSAHGQFVNGKTYGIWIYYIDSQVLSTNFFQSGGAVWCDGEDTGLWVEKPGL